MTTDAAPQTLKVSTLTSKIRETINTPFHHGGRVPGLNGGMDCGGPMVWALQQLGYDFKDKPHYGRGDSFAAMLEVLRDNNFLPEKTAKPGDLILIRTGSMYHHLVYLTEFDTVIHAWFTTGINKVVETTMLPEWEKDIHSIWRFSSLERG